jgi:hypothetical protein
MLAPGIAMIADKAPFFSLHRSKAQLYDYATLHAPARTAEPCRERAPRQSETVHYPICSTSGGRLAGAAAIHRSVMLKFMREYGHCAVMLRLPIVGTILPLRTKLTFGERA